MNVSALLQESPSGDFRNRQQAQKQQQQQHQQLQRQLTPQPQQAHDRRTSFDSVRDHDPKDREREREPDPHRNRASSIPSRSQIDLPFPISNSMSKLNQPSHGPGLGIGYPNDHPSSRASHHQLPPPSSLTGDLSDPGTRLPPPREQPPHFPPREPPPPFHSHHDRPPPPLSSGQQGFGIDGRHHSSHQRPPSDRPPQMPFMPPPPLDYTADRNLKPLPKPINAHPGGGSHPLFPTTVTTTRPGNASRPKSPAQLNYSEQSSMFDGPHLPLPPPPPPSHSQHPRSRASIIGQASHPSSNRSSPAMGSLPRLDDHLPPSQNVGVQMSQSGNHIGPGPPLPGLHHPPSSSSPRTQNKMTTGPAAPTSHNPGYFTRPSSSPTREQRERDYERWERDRDWEREQRERSREIMHVERGEKVSRSGSARGMPGFPDPNGGGGPPRQTLSREEREWERHRVAGVEREREMQMRKEAETNSGFLSRVGPPTQRNEHPPNDHVLSRSQQMHPSHLQPHHNNHQQSHLQHGSHHHHHHHHHPRNSASKGKSRDLGSHKNQNVNPIVVVEPHHQQHSITHRPPPHYGEPPYKPLPSPKTGPNDLPIPSINGNGLSPLDHYNQNIHHNQRTAHLHHSQSLPNLPPPSIMTQPSSPQVSHPIHLFPPAAPDPFVSGVHVGVFVYPRLPFPFFDFPEKVIVNVDKDGGLVPDEVLANENNDPARAAMLEEMVVLEKEVDREVRATIVLPWGLLYDELPTMFSKGESGWKGLNLWGGGVIPRGGTTPAEAQPSGPTIGGRRVYTDDSDLALCVLHSGFVNMGGMRKAKANKMSMKVEVKLTREGRFVGGFGSVYHGGLPGKGGEGGFDSANVAGGDGEDGRRMLSGGWGNGHDGAGLEILAVEFIQELPHSGGLWNRKQRLKEYAERRLVVCQTSLPSVGKRKRAQCRRLAVLGGKPYRGLDSKVWYDISGDDTRWMDNNSLVFSQSGSPTFKYNSAALKSALLPSLPEDDQLVSRSRKRQKLHLDGASSDPNAPQDYPECGVILETSKERFLVVRHGKIAQSIGAGGVNEATPEKPTFTISLIQGEVEITECASKSTTTTTTRSENLTPVPEEPKSPVPVPEQPTKEPSPVEPLPPVSTPQELKEMAKDSESGRSMSVVDMELDTSASVTPTATAGPGIPKLAEILPSGGKLHQHQDTKPTVSGERSKPEEKVTPMGDTPAKSEINQSKPPSPASVTEAEIASTDVPPLDPVPGSQPEAQVSPQVKLQLHILQRNIRGEDLVFGDGGLGVLSADMDPLDNTKKGWLIEAPRWRKYTGGFSDCIVVG